MAELQAILAESPESERRYLDSRGGTYRLDAAEAELFNRNFRATTGTTPSRYRRIDEV